MRRTILREVGFVVLLTISVYVLTLLTACGGYETSSPYPTPVTTARSIASCGGPPASFEQTVYYDISY